MKISERLAEIAQPASIVLAQRARELRAAGRKVIDLTTGDPDYPLREEIKASVVAATQNGPHGYTPSAGFPELREAIAERFGIRHSVNLSADNVLVTPGAKQAIYYTLCAVLNPGDEVLVPEPSWLSYQDMVRLAGGSPKAVSSTAANNFICTVEEIERCITPRTKVLIINNPVNPTGKCWPEATLAALVAIAQRNELLILSDEIYDEILFDPNAHKLLPQIDGANDCVVSVSGFSKTYSMTGMRLGYLVAAPELVRATQVLQEQIATCPSSYSQAAGLAALGLDQTEHATALVNFYSSRADAVCAELESKGVEVIKPEAAFYVFLRPANQTNDPLKTSQILLDEYELAMVPGIAYGACASSWIRMALTQDTGVLLEASARIAQFSAKHS